jgi:hypothetical protein
MEGIIAALIDIESGDGHGIDPIGRRRGFQGGIHKSRVAAMTFGAARAEVESRSVARQEMARRMVRFPICYVITYQI